jgi:hypothetical protein
VLFFYTRRGDVAATVIGTSAVMRPRCSFMVLTLQVRLACVT